MAEVKAEEYRQSGRSGYWPLSEFSLFPNPDDNFPQRLSFQLTNRRKKTNTTQGLSHIMHAPRHSPPEKPELKGP